METQQSMMKKLIATAQEDTDFRGRLIADPSSALKQAFNIDVPEDSNVVVHEDDARTANLVLPASTELTDVHLQQAAGGSSCSLWDSYLGEWD